MRGILRALFLVLALSWTGCSAVDKAAVENVQKSQEKILPKFTEYVDKDTALSADQKDDWKKLVESLRRLTQALKDSGK